MLLGFFSILYPGTLFQTATALIFTMAYLTMQTWAAPYKLDYVNYVAMIFDFLLVGFLFGLVWLNVRMLSSASLHTGIVTHWHRYTRCTSYIRYRRCLCYRCARSPRPCGPISRRR